MHLLQSDWMDRWGVFLLWALLLVCLGIYAVTLWSIDQEFRKEKEKDRRFWRWYRKAQQQGRRLYVVRTDDDV